MRRWVTGTALLVLMVAAVAASAAEQGGGRGGRGGRGQGGPGGPGGFGFGMGMMGGFGGGANLMMLVGIEEVQKEIEMLDDQKEELRKIGEQMRAERGGGDRPNFREMSEEEREKAMAKLGEQMRERAKASKAKLAEVLLPHQMARLEEIALQQQGTMALADPDVAQKLGVTAEQKTKIENTMKENLTAMGEKMQELFQSGDREGMRDRMTALRKEMEQKVLANLTPEQQKKFEEMKGKEFKMPERQFGGFGGPGGRRGGEGGEEGRPKRPAKE